MIDFLVRLEGSSENPGKGWECIEVLNTIWVYEGDYDPATFYDDFVGIVRSVPFPILKTARLYLRIRLPGEAEGNVVLDEELLKACLKYKVTIEVSN